ncbi:DNA topoisomerase (ATP-hydrolyzing) [Entamoeba marina]
MINRFIISPSFKSSFSAKNRLNDSKKPKKNRVQLSPTKIRCNEEVITKISKKNSKQIPPYYFIQDVLDKIHKYTIDFFSYLDSLTKKDKSPIANSFTKSYLIKQTRLFTILNAVQQAIQQNIYVTKRHIYYLDQHLFGSQNIVNALIKNLCLKVFGCTEQQLHVISAPKGFCSGEMSIQLGNKEVNFQSTLERIIPNLSVNNPNNVFGDFRIIIIVEKYTVFTKIRQSKWFQNKSNSILLITACGYPDKATKQFINYVSEKRKCEICCLVDFDAYGLDIYYNYIRKDKENTITVPVQLLLFDYLKTNFNSIESYHKLELTKRDLKKVC